jgi:hypothetical protein
MLWGEVCLLRLHEAGLASLAEPLALLAEPFLLLLRELCYLRIYRRPGSWRRRRDSAWRSRRRGRRRRRCVSRIRRRRRRRGESHVGFLYIQDAFNGFFIDGLRRWLRLDVDGR